MKLAQNQFNLNHDLSFYPISPSQMSGCIAYWKFNEGSGNYPVDSVGGRIGSLVNNGNGYMWQQGRYTSGIFAENSPVGGSKSVFISNFAHNPNAGTISFWAKNVGPGSPNNFFFRSDVNTRTYITCNSTGSLGFSKGNPNTGLPTVKLTSGTFNHIVLSWEPSGTSNVGSFWGYNYINNVCAGSKVFASAASGTFVTFFSIGGTSEWGRGYASELSMFNRRLSDTELGIIYHGGSGQNIPILSDNNQIIPELTQSQFTIKEDINANI